MVTPDEELFLVPQLEYEEAKENSRVPVEYFKKGGADLYEKLKAFNLKRLGIEGRTSYSSVQSLKEKVGVEEFAVVDDVIKELRMVKTPEEIEVIKRACQIADKAMLVAIEEVREGGVREREVAAKMEYVMKMEGGLKRRHSTR